ncbi:MAG: anthranilate phosphoribosyltransferase [Campylobacteraceae bacterium 4484_4]|nr:MAG: anthranilate phosphoribosyltransferase [Campylobacteraceae bacterium 4484_4]
MSYEEAVAAFTALFENKMSDAEARALLVDLYEKGENAEEIAAAAYVMRKHSIRLEIPEDLRQKLIDIVGTGGDKSGSFNISSTVALLLASMGCYVAKHGNRAITSKSGAADMLEKLGINLNLKPQQQVKMLEETGFAFMFAIHHHPAMRYIMPIRKSLSHRTIFNILGPLTNPAGAKRYLLGVFDRDFIPRMAEALLLLGAESAYVVSSRDGMDEASISDITFYTRIQQNRIVESGEMAPEDFGIARAPFDTILGGDADINAFITTEILSGKEKGPKRDIVLLNAALALVAETKAADVQEGIDLARETIESGRAIAHLKKIIEISNRL